MAEWKDIWGERKLSFFITLIVFVVIWIGFGMIVNDIKEHISEDYSHINLLIFFGLTLYGLFGVSTCGWLGISLCKIKKHINLRIEIKG